jgi:hypothetical protein
MPATTTRAKAFVVVPVVVVVPGDGAVTKYAATEPPEARREHHPFCDENYIREGDISTRAGHSTVRHHLPHNPYRVTELRRSVRSGMTT